MTTSTLGLLAGLLFAIAIIVGGVSGFFIALVLAALGYIIGGHFDGEIDLGQLLGRGKRG